MWKHYLPHPFECGRIQQLNDFTFPPNFSPLGDVWIGAYDLFGNDDFYWLDGQPIEDGYTNFDDNEPDGGTSDALFMESTQGFTWYDTTVTADCYVMCEIDI